MSKADKAATTKSRLCPEQEVIYNGVRIVVKPLRWGRVPAALGMFEEIYFFVSQELLPRIKAKTLTFDAVEGEILNKLKTELFGSVNDFLNECVSVPDIPDATVEDLPAVVVPEILDIFYSQNIDLKNWRALIQKRSVEWGIDWTSLSQSQNPS